MTRRLLAIVMAWILVVTGMAGPVMAAEEIDFTQIMEDQIAQIQNVPTNEREYLGAVFDHSLENQDPPEFNWDNAYKINGNVTYYLKNIPVGGFVYTSAVDEHYSSSFRCHAPEFEDYELAGFIASVPNFAIVHEELDDMFYIIYRYDERYTYDGMSVRAVFQKNSNIVDAPVMQVVTVTYRWQDGSQQDTRTKYYIHTLDDFNGPLTRSIPENCAVIIESTSNNFEIQSGSFFDWLHIPTITQDEEITITIIPEPDESEVELTNLVQSPDYADLSPWYLSPEIGTMEADDGVLTLTIDDAADMFNINLRQDVPLDTSHLYYVRSDMNFDQSTFPGASSYFTVLNLGNNQLLNQRYASGWTTVSAIGSPSHNGNHRFQQMFRVSPTGNHEGGVMQSREPMVIDLTEAFGAGNEPTIEWCDANIPFFDGTMTVIA